jgi:hypothetical protein
MRCGASSDGAAPARRSSDLHLDDRPLAVELEYRIEPARRAEFVAASSAVGRMCRRGGALFWRLYRDLDDPRLFRERFIVLGRVPAQPRSHHSGRSRIRVADARFPCRIATSTRYAFDR